MDSMNFVIDTIFEMSRLHLEPEPVLSDGEINKMILNLSYNNGDTSNMFLHGKTYIMTVDKRILSVLH